MGEANRGSLSYPRRWNTWKILFHLFICSQTVKAEGISLSNWDSLISLSSQVDFGSAFASCWNRTDDVPNGDVSCQIMLCYPFEPRANDCSTSDRMEVTSQRWQDKALKIFKRVSQRNNTIKVPDSVSWLRYIKSATVSSLAKLVLLCLQKEPNGTSRIIIWRRKESNWKSPLFPNVW